MAREITWRFQNLEVAYHALIEMQKNFPSAVFISERSINSVELEAEKSKTPDEKRQFRGVINAGKAWSEEDKEKFVQYANMDQDTFNSMLPGLVNTFGRSKTALTTRRFEYQQKRKHTVPKNGNGNGPSPQPPIKHAS